MTSARPRPAIAPHGSVAGTMAMHGRGDAQPERRGGRTEAGFSR